MAFDTYYLFFWNFYFKNYIHYNDKFSFLFNSYYNNSGERILRTSRSNLTYPTVDKIYDYRAYVDEIMLELLSNSGDIELDKLVILGLNHEQQHQELLITDIKYMFGQNPMFPIYKNDFNLLKDTNSNLDLYQ